MSGSNSDRLVGGDPLVVAGWGAVSPAGWGAGALADAVERGEPLPVDSGQRCPGAPVVSNRRAPPPDRTASWLRLPRLRRAGVATRHAAGAVLEALGMEASDDVERGGTGLVCGVQNGCVQFSRRFYEEALSQPGLASPILFPETVFNAPGSHLCAMLGAPAVSYTLVGDSGVFFDALEVAALWLETGRVDDCLVVVTEEGDWLSGEALDLLAPGLIAAEGAAAVWLKKANNLYPRDHAIRLRLDAQECGEAGGRVAGGSGSVDDGSRVERVLGHGFAASGGWQVVAACERLARCLADRMFLRPPGSAAGPQVLLEREG